MLEARALVFPSRNFEVCPMVIVEALASGLPVFAHDLGATPELIPDAARDSLVGFSDGKWAAALESLADDGLLDRLGMANRQAFEDRHTIQLWLANHESLYRDAVAAA